METLFSNNNQIYDWNPDRIQQLKKLYRNGKSFALIAADIGVSRNAAIGKAHRLKLPERSQIIECKVSPRAARPKKPRDRRRKRVAAEPVPVPVPRPVIVIPDRDYSCPINDLNNSACRYPLWDTSTLHHQRLYCGHPSASVDTGVPYCVRHAMVCGGSSHDAV